MGPEVGPEVGARGRGPRSRRRGEGAKEGNEEFTLGREKEGDEGFTLGGSKEGDEGFNWGDSPKGAGMKGLPRGAFPKGAGLRGLCRGEFPEGAIRGSSRGGPPRKEKKIPLGLWGAPGGDT